MFVRGEVWVNRRRLKLVLAFGVTMLLTAVGVAVATGGRGVNEQLTGFEETPQSLSTPANGEFNAHPIGSERIAWELSYRGFETNVTQAHIHFGQRATTGGISVWLCGNPSATINPPAGTAACPLREGTVTGVAERDDVVGPAGQGIAATEWEEFVAALRAGFTYANVHSEARPAGEIRAQLGDDRGRPAADDG
jgi:CHRD domain